MPKKLVVLSGAGISAESGIKTFRDSGGLWEGHDIMEVASPQGWKKNPELVLDFYNKRRRQAAECDPNKAHLLIKDLENHFDVEIITQNIDDLHERAGSKNVLHLHGEIFKAKSSLDDSLVYDIGSKDINLGDKCERGSQLRPHVVWFGEMVPMMDPAARITLEADFFLIIGTSLVVYPAASLVAYVPQDSPIFLIDPKADEINYDKRVKAISKKATEGMEELYETLIGLI